MIPVEGLTAENKTTASAVPTLTIKYGRQEGLVYRLDADSATIGRSPKCAVFLNDMTVSRDHALIEKVDGVWTIRDAASFNGVWVNNKNIDHAVLRDGDIIQIGCFILKFSE